MKTYTQKDLKLIRPSQLGGRSITIPASAEEPLFRNSFIKAYMLSANWPACIGIFVAVVIYFLFSDLTENGPRRILNLILICIAVFSINIWRMLKKQRSEQMRVRFGLRTITVEKYQEEHHEWITRETFVWDDIEHIRVFRDFIHIKPFASMTALGRRGCLFPKDVDKTVNQLLAMWRAAVDSDGENVKRYTPGEAAELQPYIESTFGEITTVADSKDADTAQLRYAVIAPTTLRPYYTVLTIGAGPTSLPYVSMNDGDSHYFNSEFMDCLPPNYAWPDGWQQQPESVAAIRFLHDSFLSIAGDEDTFALRKTYIPDDIFPYEGLWIDLPLPSMAANRFITLSTGLEVGFLQLLPIYDPDCDCEIVDESKYLDHVLGVEIKRDENGQRTAGADYTEAVVRNNGGLK